MTVQQAKELDMVDYLSKLGYHPTRISRPHYWYKSPLRDENTPSFKVNRQLNRWYDFSEGKGGNLVDFGTLYHGSSVSDFLKTLDTPGISLSRHEKKIYTVTQQEEERNRLKIIQIKPIVSLPLIKYYRERRIPDAVATKYLQEVIYELKDRKYYALGFKNDDGGYELRNQYFKASSAPKGSTFINNGAKDLAVFEGFFNFLSHRAMYQSQEDHHQNYLILNSTSFFQKTLPRMLEHRFIFLYLDNDNTGQRCSLQAITLNKEKFRDQRSLYERYNDLNDWLVHIGQSQKQQFRQKP